MLEEGKPEFSRPHRWIWCQHRFEVKRVVQWRAPRWTSFPGSFVGRVEQSSVPASPVFTQVQSTHCHEARTLRAEGVRIGEASHPGPNSPADAIGGRFNPLVEEVFPTQWDSEADFSLERCTGIHTDVAGQCNGLGSDQGRFGRCRVWWGRTPTGEHVGRQRFRPV